VKLWKCFMTSISYVNTLCIVERGSNNSREARRVDFVGFRTNETPLLVSYCFVTRRLLIELCAVISLSLGYWFLSKKNHLTQHALSCTVAVWKTAEWETYRWPLMPSVGSKKTSTVLLWSAANHMWLALFCLRSTLKPRRDFVDRRYMKSGFCVPSLIRFRFELLFSSRQI
jgi:hypothetical protein